MAILLIRNWVTNKFGAKNDSTLFSGSKETRLTINLWFWKNNEDRDWTYEAIDVTEHCLKDWYIRWMKMASIMCGLSKERVWFPIMRARLASGAPLYTYLALTSRMKAHVKSSRAGVGPVYNERLLARNAKLARPPPSELCLLPKWCSITIQYVISSHHKGPF